MAEPLGDDWRQGGFGLYVHWPFCASKCPYCDFNSHVAGTVDQRRWAEALATEIARQGRDVPGRVLGSIFIGGGTPSLMAPETVARVIEAARIAWPLANDCEITMEANPTSVERGRFQAYAQAGVNRLSMGVQALRDDDLRRLGRMHSVAEAMAAFDVARGCFDRVSFDLIYARQHQSRAQWRRELGEALAMELDHLSLYQLTVEPGTVFGARHDRGQLRGLPEDDLASDMYLETQDLCEAAGLPAYEVSNHARPGSESRHNLVYWRQGDWSAVGPGAHGRLTIGARRYGFAAHSAPGAWLDGVAAGQDVAPREVIPRDEQALEYLLMAMRLREGMDMARYRALSGTALDTGKLAELEGLGMIGQAGGRVFTTATGRPVLNAILRELAA